VRPGSRIDAGDRRKVVRSGPRAGGTVIAEAEGRRMDMLLALTLLTAYLALGAVLAENQG
jgi:hypothetical protein